MSTGDFTERIQRINPTEAQAAGIVFETIAPEMPPQPPPSNDSGPGRKPTDFRQAVTGMASRGWHMGAGQYPTPVKGNVTNAELACVELSQADFRLNDWTGLIEHNGEPWEAKTGLPLLMAAIEAHYHTARYTPTIQALEMAVTKMAVDNRYNPVHDRLHALVWDGKDRLDKLGVNVYQTADTELNNAIAALIPRGIVARILNPGCVFPYMPILYSHRQGVGKGDSLKLFSMGYHAEGMELEGFDTQKKIQERQRGRAVIEVGEIDSIGGRALRTLKNLITDTELVNRLAYGQQATIHSIGCIFAGTTNQKHFLWDSEHRRFPVLEIPDGKLVDLAYLRANVEQILAQAVHEYDKTQDNGAVRLPKHLWQPSNEQSSDHVVVNHMESVLEAYLSGHSIFNYTNICEELRSKGVRFHDVELSRTLGKMGWERRRRRIAGVQVTVWEKTGGPSQGALPPQPMPDCPDAPGQCSERVYRADTVLCGHTTQ